MVFVSMAALMSSVGSGAGDALSSSSIGDGVALPSGITTSDPAACPAGFCQ